MNSTLASTMLCVNTMNSWMIRQICWLQVSQADFILLAYKRFNVTCVIYCYAVPGGSDGPSGVLVCCENYIIYKKFIDQNEKISIRCPIPRRRVSNISMQASWKILNIDLINWSICCKEIFQNTSDFLKYSEIHKYCKYKISIPFKIWNAHNWKPYTSILTEWLGQCWY